MSDDVAAVLAEAIHKRFPVGKLQSIDMAIFGLAALTDAGYAVVRLPEGVAVAHGARLVDRGYYGAQGDGSWRVYSIEDTP